MELKRAALLLLLVNIAGCGEVSDHKPARDAGSDSSSQACVLGQAKLDSCKL